MRKIKAKKHRTARRRSPRRPPLFILPTFLLALLALLLILGSSQSSFASPAMQPNFQATASETDPNLAEALQTALESHQSTWGDFDWQIDNVIYNTSNDQVLIWLAPIDPNTGEVLGSEPRQAFASRSSRHENWLILLDDDPAFTKTLSKSEITLPATVEVAPAPSPKAVRDVGVYGGYYLPWEVNLTKRLTWSVSHTSCNPTYYCEHAFDFADGTMFPIMASKPGTVYHWKDTCANYDPYCTNSITLEDRTTTPWTYQIYLHLAQNSIPAELKQVGVLVAQGQFIANVDDTGYSTGHHVHFMVVSADTLYKSTSGYYFGCALDITFRDVFINWDAATQGGRPRLAYEAETYGGEGQTYYTSGNQRDDQPYEYIFFPLFR